MSKDKDALEAGKTLGLLVPKRFRAYDVARTDLVPLITGAYKPADKGVDHIDYTDHELKNDKGVTVTESSGSSNPNGSLTQFDVSKRNSDQAYGSVISLLGVKIYPQTFVRAGILATDLLYNVPCYLLSDRRHSSRLNRVKPIEQMYDLRGTNVTPSNETTDPRGSGGSITTVISRHPHMTATAGCYCVATFLGNEWRPIYIEDSPAMRYGCEIDIGKDIDPNAYDYYAKYWWWRTKPENKLRAKRWV